MRIALRLWVGRLYISSRVFDSQSVPRAVAGVALAADQLGEQRSPPPAALVRTEDENETRQKTIHHVIAVGGRRVPIPGVGSRQDKTFRRSANCVAARKSSMSH